MKKLIVFASGTGSNFQALADHLRTRSDVAIGALVCDKPHAAVIGRAQALGIPVITIDYRAYASKAAAEQALLSRLPAADLVVLAGFMRIVGPTLLAAFPDRIINLHPALLPSFPGRTGIEDAWRYGVKVTGVTVHYVDAGIDSGRIIAQAPVAIAAGESLAHLEARIHAVEHDLLPQTVDQLILKGAI
ncbi:phosphoribosylglycinamide formyltransferase [Lacticaseibacillus suihuaensis]